MVYRFNEVNLIGVRSSTFSYVKKILNEVNIQNNIQLKINVCEFDSVEKILLPKGNNLLVLPAEAIATIFLLNVTRIDTELSKYLHESCEEFFNVTYFVSETKVSQALGKPKKNLFSKYKEVENFVSELFELNDKFHKSSTNLILTLVREGLFL